MKKEYELQNGKTVVFEYDENRIGKVTVEAMDCLIDMLPKWIPCSERLPEKFGDYLVSVKRHGWNCEEHIENDIAYWDDLEGFHKAEEVLAWMPLPEPWRGENE